MQLLSSTRVIALFGLALFLGACDANSIDGSALSGEAPTASVLYDRYITGAAEIELGCSAEYWHRNSSGGALASVAQWSVASLGGSGSVSGTTFGGAQIYGTALGKVEVRALDGDGTGTASFEAIVVPKVGSCPPLSY